MKISPSFFTVILLLASTSLAISQNTPPWSNGSNALAEQKGYIFQLPDVDNMPDLHGDPTEAKLVIFIGGNQFFVHPPSRRHVQRGNHGERYYVIQNGVRLTGMRAWSAAGAFRLNHPTRLILVASKRRLFLWLQGA
jgi:hypothetical protein